MNALNSSLLATALALGLGVSAVNAHETHDAPERTVGQAIDDASITASVKARLLADQRTKGFDINVGTVKGVVTLAGGADSQAARMAAAELAGEVEGVALVKNELIVAEPGSEARQKANTATASGQVRDALDKSGDGIDDVWITSKVKAQLLADTAVKGTQIKVQTQANVVTLSGTAASTAARAAAIKIAAGTRGVKTVVADQLRVQ